MYSFCAQNWLKFEKSKKFPKKTTGTFANPMQAENIIDGEQMFFW